MRKTACLLLLLAGCAGHSVKFAPILRCKISPTNHATAINGTIDEARALWAKAKLPHVGIREKYDISYRALDTLNEQLGSDEYILIGEVYGGGNARANQATLTEALCRRAAKKGGDVVLVFRRGTTEQQYHYTTPSSSTTSFNASAYDYGDYATVDGTSYTTYYPGQTYSGVFYKPYANGLVLKHDPGVADRRNAIMRLSDSALARLYSLQETLAQERRITLQDFLARIDEAIEAERATELAHARTTRDER